MLKHVNQNDFEKEVLKNEKPILVDFFANWCGPCKMIGPVLEKIGKENDSFDIAKIDSDENRELAMEQGIQALPTMKIFVAGEEKEKLLGFMTEDQILDVMSKYTN